MWSLLPFLDLWELDHGHGRRHMRMAMVMLMVMPFSLDLGA